MRPPNKVGFVFENLQRIYLLWLQHFFTIHAVGFEQCGSYVFTSSPLAPRPAPEYVSYLSFAAEGPRPLLDKNVTQRETAMSFFVDILGLFILLQPLLFLHPTVMI